jgi:hypothetical protein
MKIDWGLAVQCGILVAVVATCWVYYQMLRTMRDELKTAKDASSAQNVLALVNFLQAEHVREARDFVRNELRHKCFADWDDKDRKHASTVCSTYDTAGIIIQSGSVSSEPLLDNWGPSILDCFEVVRPLMKELRKAEQSGPRYCNDFEWLHQRVVEYGGPAQSRRSPLQVRPDATPDA